MIYNRIEKKEITNNVINKFMNEWEGDMWSRYEMNVEYKLNNGKIIEIGTYDNEDYSDKNYYMTIDLHDPREDHMTWRYESEFIIGRYWVSDYDGDNIWKCDNTIKSYIKKALNKIFKGMAHEED